MKHVSENMMRKIETAAEAMANLETGSRNQTKAQASWKIDLMKKYGKEVKALPKCYSIYYSNTENLGTRKWSDCYTDVSRAVVHAAHKAHETDKSIVVVSDLGYRKVIDKAKIIAYVW